MPGGDRTGPMGSGPMTGRGAGYCAGFDAPGFANSIPGNTGRQGGGMGPRGRGGFGGRGRGRGAGFGAGQGWRNRSGGAAGQMGQWQPGFATWSSAGTPASPSAADSGPQQEKEMLRQQVAQLEQALNEVKQRMDSLETGSGNQDG